MPLRQETDRARDSDSDRNGILMRKTMDSSTPNALYICIGSVVTKKKIGRDADVAGLGGSALAATYTTSHSLCTNTGCDANMNTVPLI